MPLQGYMVPVLNTPPYKMTERAKVGEGEQEDCKRKEAENAAKILEQKQAQEKTQGGCSAGASGRETAKESQSTR